MLFENIRPKDYVLFHYWDAIADELTEENSIDEQLVKHHSTLVVKPKNTIQIGIGRKRENQRKKEKERERHSQKE